MTTQKKTGSHENSSGIVCGIFQNNLLAVAREAGTRRMSAFVAARNVRDVERFKELKIVLFFYGQKLGLS